MSETFGARSTTDEVLEGVDLRGKRVLVTGVSAGLGVETARALAARGAHVIGAARDLAKARRATAGVRGVELIELDLASLASARAAAEALLDDGQILDLVIANAGVMACPKRVTADGFETQFGTNHLGHFVFVNSVAPLMRQGARFVSLASSGHRVADVDLDDPGFERTEYREFVAYGRSKTANILFAVEFDRRFRDRGIRAAAVHPGVIQTELSRHTTQEAIEELIRTYDAPRPDGAVAFEFKTIPQGAATSVWAGVAAKADEIGGRYCEDCRVAEVNDGPGLRQGVRSYALDPERAKALWAKSEEMVGQRF
ncbi:SDR family NAD(P)-dependent oxidoreductase [Methylopila turkensis]|uniref:Probable oxidoreductase n=1 Tax=Methylopila turkensis TaxID=1437816 RepID=A0A9W6N6L2_9HYPH|nr:SDR family NAD(P)-dependent oxidoreductase [Methylopila turkensis]GLK79436.1 oxidoreductase [Methylopila turkensis]